MKIIPVEVLAVEHYRISLDKVFNLRIFCWKYFNYSDFYQQAGPVSCSILSIHGELSFYFWMFEISKLSIDLTINRWTFNIELSLFPPACQYWDMYRCSSFFSPYVIYSSTSSTLLLTPISTTMSNIFLQVLISTVTFIISTADELQEVRFLSLLACDMKEFMWLAISSQTLNSVLPSLNSLQTRQLYRMSQARLNSLGWFSSSSFWTILLWFSSPSSLP